MLEDMFEILSLFPGVVEFRFVEAGSSVSETWLLIILFIVGFVIFFLSNVMFF